MLNKTFRNELHLQSALGELKLIEAQADIKDKLSYIRHMFETDLSLSAIIIMNGETLAGFLTRKQFYECLSKPFGLELFSKGTIGFLMEDLELEEPNIFNSSMLIVDAVSKYLENSKAVFDESIIVKIDNSGHRILDTYQLILAHSQINTIAMQKLKEANELKTEMLNIAAHDLKNPLYSIISLAKLMKQNYREFGENSLEMLEQIETISSHMFELIIDLLNSTVIESGRIELRKQIFDMDELVSAIIFQNKPLAGKKNQVIKYHVDKNIDHVVEGDSLKLRESIENLLSNAIKYSPFESEIEVGLQRLSSRINFHVKDHGPGLTDEDKTKLFGKFQRLSAQPTNGESSTGLGLFIAKQIVELHNGVIGVESRPGEGSTFFIELNAIEI